MTQRHCKVNCLVPVMVILKVTMHLHHFSHIFSFLFCLIICITHASFEALKSGFEDVSENDTMSHGVIKSQLVPSSILSNDMVCLNCAETCVWYLKSTEK